MQEYFTELFKSISKQNIDIFGNLLIFFSTVIESIPLIGYLSPAPTFIVLAGFFAHQDIMTIEFIFISTILGAIIGDIVAYYLGKKYGEELLIKHANKIKFDRVKRFKMKYALHNHFVKTLFIGRYHPLTRAITPFLAGSVGVESKKFHIWNIINGICWGSTWIFIGYLSGKSFEIVSEYIGLTIIVLTILTLIYFIYKKKN
jgi:undecaprenyl-diphosphatase